MGQVIMFNHISIDGFFADANNDMSWAHSGGDDPEYKAFVEGNASGNGILLFGRVTYELMVKYWPTNAAATNDPGVAKGINKIEKVVFSKTLDRVSWNNTKLVKNDIVSEVQKMKKEFTESMVILGSGSIVNQLSKANLIDQYLFLVNPIILGKGKTLFPEVEKKNLKLQSTRAFKNGKVLLTYQAT